MSISYNHIAGQSVERLEALSDGIFGVGMTLLVLDLRVPAHELVHSEHGLWVALLAIAPNVLTYLMSFLTLGIFWHGQQVLLYFCKKSDLHLSWLQLAFLFTVTMMPFTTKLLSEYIEYRLVLVCYWLNIVLLGSMLFMSWRYALRVKLVKETISKAAGLAVERRIIFGQALYAFGALLCLINTYMSITFIVLVQVYFALAPRFEPAPAQ